MKKAVIYARYSSDRQREESIEGQIRVCEQYAERNDLQIIHIYADRALTGRTDKRPEFQMMIRDSAFGTSFTLIRTQGRAGMFLRRVFLCTGAASG
jgi:DNA invertase Pin-like site-specific DNA recombinase